MRLERLLEQLARQKERLGALGLEIARLRAASIEPTEGCLAVFDSVLEESALRELVNLLAEKSAVAAAFSGSDEEGWRYIIGSRRVDLRKKSREINGAIAGRGGGSPEMIQGRAMAKEEELKRFFETWRPEE